MEFFELEIIDKKLETSDTISIYFKVPEELKDKFKYHAGQYITLVEQINGEEVRRSYSICTAPYLNSLATTIKRLPGGLFSTYAHSNYKIGKKVKVSLPEGKFQLKSDPFKPKTYYFFAAGSDITPIKSMISQVVEEEPLSVCYLLYGNRDEDNIIFKEQLDEIQDKYAGQLEVVYALSKPKSDKP
ncbi:MAG TPA: FAD-binding oxidoreductase, partial [Saprospiraceae bacterium]|nr:FAD-binding oxidoreductase [Saprospiraceae bacterium]